MKTYRMNSVMGGGLYFMGTVFGVLGTVFGGEILSSITTNQPLDHFSLLTMFANDVEKLRIGAFLYLLMGISLTAMTVFLYPVIRKVNEELALGMLLFRGALEGAGYIVSTILILCLMTFGSLAGVFSPTLSGANSEVMLMMASFLYHIQGVIGPVLTLVFLIGSTCLFVAFYRSKLIPRWLSIWGLVGVVPYAAYAILTYFKLDNGIGLYLQMVLAPQEVVMGLWLVIKGFNVDALAK